MALQRRVWRMPRAGSLHTLRLVDEVLPAPAPGEARVRVRSVGLNFADVFACQGLYSATPSGSFIPGLECAGDIEALGPDTGSFVVGDRVFALTRFGGYASALNVSTSLLHRLPDDWTYEQGAAYPVQALTAWYGLVALGQVKAGETVLVHSAAGGVGLHALAILQALGVRIVATVGAGAKQQFLVSERGLSPEAVIVRDRRHFRRQLDDALHGVGTEGFDLVFDALLGPWFEPAFERLRPEGRHVVFGAAAFMNRRPRPDYLRLAWQYLRRPRLDPLAMIAANRGLLAFNLIWLWDRVERLPGAYRELAAYLHRPPYVGERFEFARAPAAMARLQAGTTMGKVVLSLDQSAGPP